MPTQKSSPKKLSPKKKKKAVKADYGGVYFDAAQPDTNRDARDGPLDDDPMASYRAAAAAAAKAVAKERKEKAQLALYRKIFARMDTDADGRVQMAEVIENVAEGTAQLSQRAASVRPEGAVELQLPMEFGLDEWIGEMRRISALMDEPTFEANVLGLFACFRDETDAPMEPPIVLKAPPQVAQSVSCGAALSGETSHGGASAGSIDRRVQLRELFDAMDTDGDGYIDLDDFLSQARSSVEADELRSLFRFFRSTFGTAEAAVNAESAIAEGATAEGAAVGGAAVGGAAIGGAAIGGFDAKLGFDAFAEGTLTRTPIGKLRDAAFASAVRAMKADVQMALRARETTLQKMAALQELFTAMDVDGTGTLDWPKFVRQARTDAEADELRATFDELDGSEGQPDGKLTFTKFAAGTLMNTPLGKLPNDLFDSTVHRMIADVRAALQAAESHLPTPASKPAGDLA